MHSNLSASAFIDLSTQHHVSLLMTNCMIRAKDLTPPPRGDLQDVEGRGDGRDVQDAGVGQPPPDPDGLDALEQKFCCYWAPAPRAGPGATWRPHGQLAARPR